jgi:hypothetical protein
MVNNGTIVSGRSARDQAEPERSRAARLVLSPIAKRAVPRRRCPLRDKRQIWTPGRSRARSSFSKATSPSGTKVRRPRSDTVWRVAPAFGSYRWATLDGHLAVSRGADANTSHWELRHTLEAQTSADPSEWQAGFFELTEAALRYWFAYGAGPDAEVEALLASWLAEHGLDGRVSVRHEPPSWDEAFDLSN